MRPAHVSDGHEGLAKSVALLKGVMPTASSEYVAQAI